MWYYRRLGCCESTRLSKKSLAIWVENLKVREVERIAKDEAAFVKVFD